MKLMIILTIIACFIISDYHAPHNSGLQLIKYLIDCIWPGEKKTCHWEQFLRREHNSFTFDVMFHFGNLQIVI